MTRARNLAGFSSAVSPPSGLSAGIITAIAFYGDGSTLTGIVTGITAGDNISVSGSTGNVTITGLANTANVIADSLVVSGISTLGSVTSSSVNVTGVVTANSLITGDVNSTGIVTAVEFDGQTELRTWLFG